MTAALKRAPQHSYRLSAFERKDHDFYPTPADLVASLALGLPARANCPGSLLIPAGAMARSGAALRLLGST